MAIIFRFLISAGAIFYKVAVGGDFNAKRGELFLNSCSRQPITFDISEASDSKLVHSAQSTILNVVTTAFFYFNSLIY